MTSVNAPYNFLILGDESRDLLIYKTVIDHSQKLGNLRSYPHYDGQLCAGATFLQAIMTKRLLERDVHQPSCSYTLIENDTTFTSINFLEKYPSRPGNRQAPESTEKVLRVDKFAFHSTMPVISKMFESYRDRICEIDEGSIIHLHINDLVQNPQIAPPDFLVIHDAGYSLRGEYEKNVEMFNTVRESWGEKKPRLVMLKVFSPFYKYEKTKIWTDLIHDLKDRLVVVTTIFDLRLCGAKISRGLSWERTVQDFIRQIQTNPDISILRQCHCLIVRIGFGGALIYFPESSSLTLVFHPEEMEGSFSETYQGETLSKTSIFMSVLLYFLVNRIREREGIVIHGENREPEQNTGGNCPLAESDLKEILNIAVPKALAILRVIHQIGYPTADISDADQDAATRIIETHELLNKVVNNPRLYEKEFLHDGMPLERLDLTPSTTYASAELNIENYNEQIKNFEDQDEWTIISNTKQLNYGTIAYNYVKEGKFYTSNEKVLAFPTYQMGGLRTVDRVEIEGYQNVWKLIREYIDDRSMKTPLSIAVFGPPGSGKSFGIKELAKTFSKASIQEQTYNLSQFVSAEDLRKAFHRIRDCAFKDSLALVFFDEFDSPLGTDDHGWLKYFLMPMQDGVFVDAEIPRPIGRAIFIFIGGRHPTYEAFSELNDPVSERKESFETSKGPDFISRLRGHVNILGCNQIDNDQLYKIRRAILLRSFLEKKAPKLFHDNKLNIDVNVLRAFIKVKKYIHENRSMQAIIEMSNLRDSIRFEPSSLPGDAQLKMHVSASNFNDLLCRDQRFDEVKRPIARDLRVLVTDGLPWTWKNLASSESLEILIENINNTIEMAANPDDDANWALTNAIPGIFYAINYSLIKEDSTGKREKCGHFDKGIYANWREIPLQGAIEEHKLDESTAAIVNIFFDRRFEAIVEDNLLILERVLAKYGFSLYPI